MKLTFSGQKTEAEHFEKLVFFKTLELLEKGKPFEVDFKGIKPKADPRVFHFRNLDLETLMRVRASVGKEIDARMKEIKEGKEGYFEPFKITFSPDSNPSDEQRGYYWGVVIPTIQEHFKNEGNFIKTMDLHEAIKDVIEDEEGLKTEKTNPITGEIYQGRITISNNGSKKDAVKYIDAVIRWAATEYGIVIPECEDRAMLEYYKKSGVAYR